MSNITLCKECWQWIVPSYIGKPCKCVMEMYEQPYENQTCDEIEDKNLDDEG